MKRMVRGNKPRWSHFKDTWWKLIENHQFVENALGLLQLPAGELGFLAESAVARVQSGTPATVSEGGAASAKAVLEAARSEEIRMKQDEVDRLNRKVSQLEIEVEGLTMETRKLKSALERSEAERLRAQLEREADEMLRVSATDELGSSLGLGTALAKILHENVQSAVAASPPPLLMKLPDGLSDDQQKAFIRAQLMLALTPEMLGAMLQNLDEDVRRQLRRYVGLECWPPPDAGSSGYRLDHTRERHGLFLLLLTARVPNQKDPTGVVTFVPWVLTMALAQRGCSPRARDFLQKLAGLCVTSRPISEFSGHLLAALRKSYRFWFPGRFARYGAPSVGRGCLSITPLSLSRSWRILEYAYVNVVVCCCPSRAQAPHVDRRQHQLRLLSCAKTNAQSQHSRFQPPLERRLRVFSGRVARGPRTGPDTH
eukprot:2943142-Prymnesium_polylepis.1